LVSQAGDRFTEFEAVAEVGMRRVRSTSEQGVVETTGRPLDIAIAGDGYLQTGSVEDKSFTRNGVLSVSATGVLVDSSGQPVLGYQGTGTALGQIDMTAVNLAGAATSTPR
jgi:flagellar basal body rod protein FlgG